MNDNVELSSALMTSFAARTGLVGERSPRRYLWTDAYAVLNFLELNHLSGETHWLMLARQLIQQVHQVLGRHRSDDNRTGWISGLSEESGGRHPTLGGLRIGKPLPERKPDMPIDDRLEWERDGQYFHYLTKWMTALSSAYRVVECQEYLRWARELAVTAYGSFCYKAGSTGQLRMYWKMSIDLTRPLVNSMGQHDALDGLITYLELECEAREPAGHTLQREIDGFRQIALQGEWATHDPLGIGGLLDCLARVLQLPLEERPQSENVLRRLARDCYVSLRTYLNSDPLLAPVSYRLAFRELGLAIGLRALRAAESRIVNDSQTEAIIQEIISLHPLADEIAAFWSNPARRESVEWERQEDINDVMLANALLPRYRSPAD